MEDEQSASGPEQVNEVHAGLRMGQRKGFKNEEKILIEECCPSFKEWIAPKGEGRLLTMTSLPLPPTTVQTSTCCRHVGKRRTRIS